MRYLLMAVVLAGSACSTTSSSIDGVYSNPQGTTLKLAGGRYEFCDRACSKGQMEVRPSGGSAGRVTFYGVPIAAYFRSAQRGANSAGLRTWGEGVETGYRVGSFGVSIDIDRERGLIFQQRR